jgi:hypothetical protein
MSTISRIPSVSNPVAWPAANAADERKKIVAGEVCLRCGRPTVGARILGVQTPICPTCLQAFVDAHDNAPVKPDQTVRPIAMYDVQRHLDEQRERIDLEWTRSIERYVKTLQRALERFTADADAVETHELDAEEYAPVFAEFNALCRMGVKFDPSFVQRIAELRQQAHDTDIDIDQDHHDDRLADGFGDRWVGGSLMAALYEDEGG